jgi:hypothetical protein
MTNSWIILLSALIGLVARLFLWRLGEWWDRPRLKVEFIPNEGGFRDEGTWTEDDRQITEICIRARVRNESRAVAKRCRAFLVKLEEVHPAGTTPTVLFDTLLLRWPPIDYEPRDIPEGINLFFDIVSVFKHEPGWLFTFKERSTRHAEPRNYRGTYRFTVLVTGDGVVPSGRKIDVSYDGDWHNLRGVDAVPA